MNAVIKDIQWPKIEDVWQYRQQVYEIILDLINTIELNLPINQSHPLWALMMGIEHSRVHFETSSVLWRLPSPASWATCSK